MKLSDMQGLGPKSEQQLISIGITFAAASPTTPMITARAMGALRGVGNQQRVVIQPSQPLVQGVGIGDIAVVSNGRAFTPRPAGVQYTLRVVLHPIQIGIATR